MSTSIAVVGDRDTTLLTHRELDAAIARMPTWACARWVGTDRLPLDMTEFDGVWLGPGTPYRNDDGVFTLIRLVRECVF